MGQLEPKGISRPREDLFVPNNERYRNWIQTKWVMTANHYEYLSTGSPTLPPITLVTFPSDKEVSLSQVFDILSWTQWTSVPLTASRIKMARFAISTRKRLLLVLGGNAGLVIGKYMRLSTPVCNEVSMWFPPVCSLHIENISEMVQKAIRCNTERRKGVQRAQEQDKQ